MFLSQKVKGLVFDQGEQVSILARLSSFKPPTVIEELKEFATNDEDSFKQAFDALVTVKKGGYAFAKCGINPEQGFIRRVTLDPKKLKDENYLTEVVSTQVRADPESHTIHILNAQDGSEFDASKVGSGKDVLFCGIPSALAKAKQDNLLEKGIYPETMELSSLLSLAALIDYLKFTKSTRPVLVLELGAQSTQSYIVSVKGIDAIRPIGVGLEAMVPVVQKELGLKDEESARKLFFSNTFDFTGMGAALCKRLLKELQSSMGFYEVQTGQSISQLVCTVLPSKLAWLETVMANQLGVTVLAPDIKPWLENKGVSLAPTVDLSAIDIRKFATLGLIIDFSIKNNDVGAA